MMPPHDPRAQALLDLMASIAPALPAADTPSDPLPAPVRPSRLHWLIHTAHTTPMALDKLARWAGFAQGVALARGWAPSHACQHPPSPSAARLPTPAIDALAQAHHTVLADIAARLPAAAPNQGWPTPCHLDMLHTLLDGARTAGLPIDTLAQTTGYIQGIACVRGWLDADEERTRTRPIFHAAAAAMGQDRPDTLGPETPTTQMKMPAMAATLPPYVLAQILSGNDEDTLRLQTVPALYIDGYQFGERALEGVPFRLEYNTTTQAITAHMEMDESLCRRMHIDRAQAQADAVSCALQYDLFSTDARFGPDEGVILRPHLPASQQSFNCDLPITLDGNPIHLPVQNTPTPTHS